MNITLCTGMLRSGSTWSFNVCRLLLQHIANRDGQPFTSFYRDHQTLDKYLIENATKQNGQLVVKVHSPAEYAMQLIYTGKANNIYTYRDPRDCVASHQTYDDVSFDISVALIRTNLLFMDEYRKSNHSLYIAYEEMMRDPLQQINKIVNYLKLDIDSNIIEEIHQQTNYEASKNIVSELETSTNSNVYRDREHVVDGQTLLHQNHIQGGNNGRWKSQFTANQIDILNREFKPWLDSLGYSI